MARTLFIFTGLQIEARAIAKLLKIPIGGEPEEYRPGVLVALNLYNGRVLRALDNNPPPRGSGMVMAGFGGALDPSLRVGDVIVDETSVGLGPDMPYKRGRIHTADEPVWAVEQKARLFRKMRAAVVDMETGRARDVARDLCMSFLSIRAISDTADEEIDPGIPWLINRNGRVSWTRLAWLLLVRPRVIPQLRRLGRSANIAGQNLANAVRYFLDRDDPWPGRIHAQR